MHESRLGELPENVERAILQGLNEAELLACAELGHPSLSRAARDDTYWRHHFEKRLKGSPLVSGDGMTYFERAVCARHLDTFRKPPALAHEASLSVPPVQILPILRNEGSELVLVCVGKSGQIALRGTDAEAAILAEWEAERFLLPEPAESLLPDAASVQLDEPFEWGAGAPATAASAVPEMPVVPEVAEAEEVEPDEHPGAAVLTKRQKKKKGKKAGDSNSSPAIITPESSPVFSPASRRSHPTKQSPGAARSAGSPSLSSPSLPAASLLSSSALAAEVGQLGAVVLSPCRSEWLDNNGSGSSAARVLHVDKWGDAWRAQFVVATVCPWPSAAAPSQASVLGCAVFGKGRFAVAGTDQCGTLVWDLEGVATMPVSSAGATQAQTHRKEGRGPCFKCGQTGHWAKSCPSAATDGQSPLADPQMPEDAASPLSPPLNCSDGAVGPAPTVICEGIGPIVAVAGTHLPASGETSSEGSGSAPVPLVFSATARKIIGHVVTGPSWRCLFAIDVPEGLDAPLGSIVSLHTADPVAHDSAALSAKGCFVWAACEHGVALAGATSLTQGSTGWSVDDTTVGVRALNGSISAVLLMQRPAGLLCGLADGRIFHCRMRAEAAGGCTASGATGVDAAAAEAATGLENTGESRSIIKCKAVGGNAPSKSAAITALKADARLPVVLSGDSQGSVKIWDSTSWRCLRTLPYFGQGSVTSLTLLVAAPLRGVAVVTDKAKEARLHLTWFGREPVPRARKQGSRAGGTKDQKAKRQYAENPGKASTSSDWRGIRPNSRKTDIGYGDKDYQHRGAGRKERRDLAARVKVHRPGGVGVVESMGHMSAPLYHSIDLQVLNTGSTQMSNPSHSSQWHQGRDDAYDDYDYYGDGVDEAAWQYEEDWE